MSFFDTILINTICILFPVLVYIFFLASKNNNNDKKNNALFEMCILTSLYLIIKFVGNKYNNYSIVLINIPLLLCYLKRKNMFSIFISLVLIIYFNIILDYKILIIIVEYILYFIIYVLINKKITTDEQIINIFTIIKVFFFSFYIFNTIEEINYYLNFSKILMVSIAFYTCTNIYYKLLKKSEKIITLNKSFKDIEHDEMVTESLFKLTHEIKNPIAVCKGYLDMINVKDINKTLKYINIIKSEINRTLIIMDDFRDYTKIKIDKNIMDINLLIEETMFSLETLLKNNKIDLKLDVVDDEIFINGDFNRLKQVIINIIKNAIESEINNNDKKLEIYTKIENNKYIISIIDNGIGMNKEELQNIGEAFYTTKKKGTGLGVLLSNEIVKLHEGEIIYKSEKNKGTQVDLVLPLLEL